MASTPTERGKYRKQGLGDSLNTWGLSNGLNGVFDVMDEALHGVETIALSANHTLTTTNYATNQSRQAVLRFTGTALATGVTVTIPATENWWVMENDAGHALEISNGAATASLPSALMSIVHTDGATITINPLPRDVPAVTALAAQTADIVALAGHTADLAALGDQTAQLGALGDQSANVVALAGHTAALVALGDQSANLAALGDQTASIATVAAHTADLVNAANLAGSGLVTVSSALNLSTATRPVMAATDSAGTGLIDVPLAFNSATSAFEVGSASTDVFDFNGAVVRDVYLGVFVINSSTVTGASAATAFTADASVANVWVHAPHTATTYEFKGFQTAVATAANVIELQIEGGGDHVIGYSYGGSANVKFPGATAPTLATGVLVDQLYVEPLNSAQHVVVKLGAGAIG